MWLNLGVDRLQLWRGKCFTNSWGVVANLALKTTGRIQVLQVTLSPGCWNKKIPAGSSEVSIRLAAGPSCTPPSAHFAAAFLQFVTVPCPLAAPRVLLPVISSRHGTWIEPGLQDQEFSSKGIKTNLWNTDDSLRTAGITLLTLCLAPDNFKRWQPLCWIRQVLARIQRKDWKDDTVHEGVCR